MGTRPALAWSRAAPLPSTDDRKRRELTKLLVHVTVERSLGPLHVLVGSETTVEDLIKTAVEMYAKERRRPLLTESDPAEFQMHYNQFSLESQNLSDAQVQSDTRQAIKS